MQKLPYSHYVVSCVKTLVFKPDGKGNFHTTCPSNYECWGCSGEFFLKPPDPRTLEQIANISPRPWKMEHKRLTNDTDVPLSGYPADYFFSLEEITEILAEYPEEDHYWLLGHNSVELNIYKITG